VIFDCTRGLDWVATHQRLVDPRVAIVRAQIVVSRSVSSPVIGIRESNGLHRPQYRTRHQVAGESSNQVVVGDVGRRIVSRILEQRFEFQHALVQLLQLILAQPRRFGSPELPEPL